MVIFHSYVSLPEGTFQLQKHQIAVAWPAEGPTRSCPLSLTRSRPGDMATPYFCWASRYHWSFCMAWWARGGVIYIYIYTYVYIYIFIYLFIYLFICLFVCVIFCGCIFWSASMFHLLVSDFWAVPSRVVLEMVYPQIACCIPTRRYQK